MGQITLKKSILDTCFKAPSTPAIIFNKGPYTKFKNPLFTRRLDKFRQYGLWERSEDFYPNDDIPYTIGVSNNTREWFFAHVTSKVGNSTFQPTHGRLYFNWRTSAAKEITHSNWPCQQLHTLIYGFSLISIFVKETGDLYSRRDNSKGQCHC